MEIKQYAPVLIPTLNRYDHFRQCLESLEKCTGADKTEVYVALDYPPSEKYVEGWKKNDAYLAEKEKSNGFKVLHVIRRERNYGVLKEHSNFDVLLNYICANYDRYIVSEDDNVFSPNFLEYINKGLELYEDRQDVLYICGYTQPYNFQFENNNYFFHRTDMSAWGFGGWVKKSKTASNFIRNNGFKKTFSLKNYIKVRKHGLNRLQQYLGYVVSDYTKKYAVETDCILTCYAIINDMYVVNPTVSKVRNIGWDELGNSFASNPSVLKKFGDIPARHLTQEIDTNTTFEFTGDPLTYFDYNNELTARVSEARISWFTYFKSLLVIICRLIVRKLGLSQQFKKLLKIKE